MSSHEIEQMSLEEARKQFYAPREAILASRVDEPDLRNVLESAKEFLRLQGRNISEEVTPQLITIKEVLGNQWDLVAQGHVDLIPKQTVIKASEIIYSS